MIKTNRRNLLKVAAVGGAAAVGLAIRPETATPADDNGPLSNATVSFGEWMTVPPLDRFPNSSPAAANHHALIPNEVKIKAGGTVNFIIAGLHQVIVYDDGRQPGNIDTTLTRPTTGTPAGVPLINDPFERIYAGLDPSTQTRDRVEVVQFPTRGTFLVICGVLPHFQQGMFGFVKVLP